MNAILNFERQTSRGSKYYNLWIPYTIYITGLIDPPPQIRVTTYVTADMGAGTKTRKKRKRPGPTGTKHR